MYYGTSSDLWGCTDDGSDLIAVPHREAGLYAAALSQYVLGAKLCSQEADGAIGRSVKRMKARCCIDYLKAPAERPVQPATSTKMDPGNFAHVAHANEVNRNLHYCSPYKLVRALTLYSLRKLTTALYPDSRSRLKRESWKK